LRARRRSVRDSANKVAELGFRHLSSSFGVFAAAPPKSRRRRAAGAIFAWHHEAANPRSRAAEKLDAEVIVAA
jgi:hypothetical protein